MKIFLYLFCITFFLISCNKKPEDMIIGQWKAQDSPEAFEFFPDGSLNKISRDSIIHGNFQVLDVGRLKLELRNKSAVTDIMIMRLLISDKELVLIDNQGKLIKYHKVEKEQ